MKNTPIQKQPSYFKKTLCTLLFLTVCSWLILLGRCLWLWWAEDYGIAFQWLAHLQNKSISIPVLHVQDSLIKDITAHLFIIGELIQHINQVVINKLYLLVSALPLFVLATLTGLIDGLNQRAIRAACLGRESTYVFHKSVPIAHRVICITLGFWLCIPASLPHELLFIGLAIFLGLITRISATRFKKYL